MLSRDAIAMSHILTGVGVSLTPPSTCLHAFTTKYAPRCTTSDCTSEIPPHADDNFISPGSAIGFRSIRVFEGVRCELCNCRPPPTENHGPFHLLGFEGSPVAPLRQDVRDVPLGNLSRASVRLPIIIHPLIFCP